MAYSVVSLEVPSSAMAGSKVSAMIRITNRHSAPIQFSAIGVLGTVPTSRFIDWQKAWISANTSKNFYGSFTMPPGSVTVSAYSYYLDGQGQWRSDASTSKRITLTAPVPVVVLLARASRAVGVELEPPPEPRLFLLDSKTVDVGILQELVLLAKAERVVTPDAVGVILLAKAEQLVLPGDITGVVLLDSAEQLVLPIDGLPPEPPEVEDNKMLWAGLAAVGIVIVGTMVASK